MGLIPIGPMEVLVSCIPVVLVLGFILLVISFIQSQRRTIQAQQEAMLAEQRETNTLLRELVSEMKEQEERR
jgi:TRAP-type C4-dicarboxylate transport system permease small subunit